MTTEEMQKMGKDSVDMALSSLSVWTKNAHAIAVEVADLSQKSFAGSAAAWEKLMGAKSLEKAVEVHGEYMKSSYEDFMTGAARLSGLCADFAKDAYKPFQHVMTKSPMAE